MTREQHLIAEATRLVQTVERGAGTPWAGDRSAEIDVAEMVTRFADDPVDGSIQVEIPDDRMTARASFYPPRGLGRPLEPLQVYEAVAAAGIVHGLCEDVVEAALFTCTTERSTLHAVEIAFGTEPTDAVPAHLRPVEHDADHEPEEDGGRVDFRKRGGLAIVSVGDALAVQVDELAGADGLTVTGETVPHAAIRVPELTAGDNTVLEAGELCAAIGGLLHVEHGTISVVPTLVLSEGVDYRSGNIDFDGDVAIAGRIADGFLVSCSGTLLATTVLDSYGIRCGRLTSAYGLIGHDELQTSVETDARLRFAQNARIVVGGSLDISQSVFKSHITARDHVRLGHGSTVVGSTVRAGLGVEADSIGSPGAATSEFYLGIDFEVDARLATIRDQTLSLSKKLHDVRLAARGESSEALSDLERRIQEAIATLSDEAAQLISRLDRSEEAALTVHGTVHAGTYVEICHRSFVVPKTSTQTVFRLDKKTGSIVTEPTSQRTTKRKP